MGINFYIENEIRSIQNIKKEDVDRAAKELLAESNMGLAAIGVEDTDKLLEAVHL